MAVVPLGELGDRLVVGIATVDERGDRRGVGERAVHDIAPALRRRQRGHVRVRAPPVGAVNERDARACEQHPALRQPTEQTPEIRQPQTTLDGNQRRPVGRTRPQEQRLAADREQRERDRRAEADRRRTQRNRDAWHERHGLQPARQPCRADAAGHDERHPRAIDDAIGRQPVQAERLGREAIERRHDDHGRQPPERQPRSGAHRRTVDDGRHGERAEDERQRAHDVVERQRAPRERACLRQSGEQRQRPERGQRRRQRERAEGFTCARLPRHAEGDGQRQQRDRGRQLSGMQQGDGGEQRRHRRRQRSRLVEPAREQREQHRQQRPRQPRADHADPNAAVHPAREARRERERDEGGRQRQPALPREPHHDHVRRDAGQQIGQPEQRLIHGAHVEDPGRCRREQRAQIREAGRIELQLRIARPPATVPRPRRRSVREHMPEPIELAGMVVESEHRAAERRGGERDAEAEQQHERQHVASIPLCSSESRKTAALEPHRPSMKGRVTQSTARKTGTVVTSSGCA